MEYFSYVYDRYRKRDKIMGKILLTGASGYIGSHLKDKLKDNHEIIAISRNAQNKKMKKM